MARKAKKVTVPTIQRSIVRVTVTADVVVRNEYEYDETVAAANNLAASALAEALTSETCADIVNTNVKTSLRNDTVKLPVPEDQ